ncbi:MAG: hypothetical protein ACREOU_11400 [Candidatus Eiseniibacteriota bacterium]
MRSYFALMAVVAALALPAKVHADQFLADFRGFDYESPNGGAGFGDVGDGYNSLGLVLAVNPALLTADFVNNEYTYLFRDLTATGSDFAAPFLFIFYTNGRFRIFEDPIAGGTAHNYGINPPNATAPSTFTDGTLILGGVVSNFVLTLDTTNNNGSFNGDITFDEGTQSGSIPPAQLNGWTFAGLTSGGGTGAPEGYVHQVDGEIRVPDVVPARPVSWGNVKNLYRH